MRRPCAALALAAATLIAVVPAQGQPKKPPTKGDATTAEAKRLFDEGAESYGRGDYEAAVTAWEKSYEISKRPLIFWSIANAYERLGDVRKAREYLAKWREAAPADEVELLDARLKKLDERIAREDELEAARKAELDKAKKEPPPPSSAEPVAPQPTPPAHERPVLGWVLATVGVGAVGVGVVLDVIGSSRRPDAAEACRDVGDRSLCRASSRDAIESSATLTTIGDAIWIGGAVLTVAGVVLVVADPFGGAKAEALRIAPMVATGAVGRPRGGSPSPFQSPVASRGGGLAVSRSW